MLKETEFVCVRDGNATRAACFSALHRDGPQSQPSELSRRSPPCGLVPPGHCHTATVVRLHPRTIMVQRERGSYTSGPCCARVGPVLLPSPSLGIQLVVAQAPNAN